MDTSCDLQHDDAYGLMQCRDGVVQTDLPVANANMPIQRHNNKVPGSRNGFFQNKRRQAGTGSATIVCAPHFMKPGLFIECQSLGVGFFNLQPDAPGLCETAFEFLQQQGAYTLPL